IHPKEVELVDLIPRQRVSCAFVRIKISLLIAKEENKAGRWLGDEENDFRMERVTRLGLDLRTGT
ncbi:hypothetical protein S245_045184, partial [Arachis hypogaea]